MSVEFFVQVAGVVLLACVWWTELKLVDALQKSAEGQQRLREILRGLTGAVDTMTDKLIGLIKQFGGNK